MQTKEEVIKQVNDFMAKHFHKGITNCKVNIKVTLKAGNRAKRIFELNENLSKRSRESANIMKVKKNGTDNDRQTKQH